MLNLTEWPSEVPNRVRRLAAISSSSKCINNVFAARVFLFREESIFNVENSVSGRRVRLLKLPKTYRIHRAIDVWRA